MKSNLLALLLLSASAVAQDRITMTGPPPEEDAIREVLDKVSKACSENDFRTFMSCFTPKHADKIRSRAENSFICGGLEMEIVDFFIISAEEESISFGLRYHFASRSSPKKMYCSKVVAIKHQDYWLLDSEKVKEVRSKSIDSVKNDVVRQDVNIGTRPAAWRHPDPANGGEEAWLPKDILYTPGPSCANGNCRR